MALKNGDKIQVNGSRIETVLWTSEVQVFTHENLISFYLPKDVVQVIDLGCLSRRENSW